MFKIYQQRKALFETLTKTNIKNTFIDIVCNKLNKITSKNFMKSNNIEISNVNNTTNKKLNKTFYKQTKYNFVSDGANPKLKKKFYKKVDIAVLHINNKDEFLKLNEFKNLEDEEDLNNENQLKKEISDFLQDEKFENLSREEIQFEIFKLKLQDFDELTQKNLLKNFDKLRTLFTGSLFNKKYYGVLLDNRKCKSMHLDELKIPTKKLALALAEEWQSQKEMVNLYKMHLNLHTSNGIRISKDAFYKRDSINKIIAFLPTDQIFYCEDLFLDKIKKEENLDINIEKILDDFKKTFDLNFNIQEENLQKLTNNNVFDLYRVELGEKNIKKLYDIIRNLDPWMISSLEMLTGITKSVILSLCFLTGNISKDVYHLIADSEEYYQKKVYGEVEGYHDILHEANSAKIHSIDCFSKLLK